MKIYHSVFLLTLLSAITMSFNSCKKITQDQLINGLWRVNTVTIDTSSVNYLNTLQHYSEGNDCCTYKLDFEKDNTVIAYYITYNNFSKIVAGNWKVTNYNEVY